MRARTLTVLALAISGVLAAGASARAATDGTLTAAGLHLATGTLVDPAGRTWIADHNAGFCRLTEPTDTAPGRIEHPRQPGLPGLRTCLGGLLPDAQPGPAAAGQPTLVDPSPEFPSSGDEMALVPDGSSKSAEVVRARWNPVTGLFEFLDRITMHGDRGRPLATSLGSDDRVYVTFQRETTIQRIGDPAGTPSVETVGRTADGRGARAVAAGRDVDGRPVVYVAESTGLRLLRPDAGAPPLTEPSVYAIPAGGAGGGLAAIGSMAYDDTRRLLWVGTADAGLPGDAGIDRLVRIETGTGIEDFEHARGFTTIGGVAVRPGGEVDVLDDPALLNGIPPLGFGRLFRVGRPVAHVTRGPLADGQPTPDGQSTRDPSPSFEVAGDGALECLLSGPGLDHETWQPCPAGGAVQVDHDLADGPYALSVRATAGGVIGLPEAKAFTVDTQAPLRPRILRPAAGSTVSGTPWFQFDAEPGATFTCRFDGEAQASPCRPGRTRSFATPATHTLEVVAVDGAGNESPASAPVTFTVDPALPPTLPPGISGGPPRHHGSTLYTAGLHIPTGAIVDPEGRVWVADHNAGFCRVTPAGEDGPGRIDHPRLPGDPGPRTCLGGLLPEAQPGPGAAGQPAFVDPTPDRPGSGDEVVLIPDGSSASSELTRARWNPDAGVFEFVDRVTTIGSGNRGTRPVAASADAAGNAYVVFQRTGAIERIAGAAGADPSVSVVGVTANGRRAGAVAAGRDADGLTTVYVGEGTGLRSLHPSAVAPEVTQPSFDLPAGTAIGALAYDLAGDRLWIATANAAAPQDAGTDVVDRVTISTGTHDAAYARGYSAIGGLAVRPDGFVLVLDDPALLDPLQPLGLGRMFHVGLPAAHVARGPLTADGTEAPDPGATSSRTPGFDVQAPEGVAECRLRRPGHGLDTGWAPCAPGGRFPAAEPLAEGDYLLTVRAVDGDVTGLVEARRFAVDLSPPARPRITSPTESVVGATPWFAFDAEPAAHFECRWEEQGGFEPCEPGHTRTFAENGDHVLEIRAIDRAGNVSQTSDPLRFSARANVTAVTIDSGPEGVTRDPNPVFTFSADAIDVEFGCRLAGTGEAFGICTSPRSYSGLADGTYTFEVRARDAVGNVSPLTRRTFTLDRTVPPEPALAPRVGGTGSAGGAGGPASGPAVTALARPAQPLTIRIAAVAPTVGLAQVRAAGIPVTVVPVRGTRLIRLRVFRAKGGRIAAAARRPRPILTAFKRAPRGRGTVRLTPGELRRLRPGGYILEVTAARSRTQVGRPVKRGLRVVR